MTGVRARRIDGAEVKLDTAFYRLLDKFFGRRVGRRAFSAVAFNLGTNRGMVCGTVSWFQFGCRLWRGNGCVQPKGRRKGFRMSCTSRSAFECDLRSRTQSCRSAWLCSALAPTNAIEAAEEDRWDGARRVLRAEPSVVSCCAGLSAQRAAWSSSQNQRGASIGRQSRVPA